MLMLPEEVVEMIAGHLTAKELAACCGVSVGWRELFNRDLFWKRFCDKRLAEYLSTTSSLVTPRFVIPQNSDSDLSPLCDWRLNYMREAHLWANLREGRCIIEDMDIVLRNTFISVRTVFFKDDFLLSFGSEIEMFDLRETPVVYVKNPFELIPNCFVDFCQIFGDRIVIVQDFIVRVYQINFMVQNWPQERIFLYNRETEYTFEERKYHLSRCLRGRRPICIIIGNSFVGSDQKSRSFHIWDLKTGMKIKEEVLKLALGSRFIDIKPATTCETEIVIVLKQNMADGDCFLFLVYSMQSFAFYPLAKSYNTYSQFLLFGDHLAIVSSNNLEIFNYKTCQMIRELSSYTTLTVDVWNNSIVFNQVQTLRRFLSSAEEVTLLGLDRKIVHFKFFNDKFFLVSVTEDNGWDWQGRMCGRHRVTKRAYWKVGNDWRQMKQTPFNFESILSVNEPSTKLVLVNNNKWILINYW